MTEATSVSYQRATTPITSFIAVATKAAALAIFIRFFLVALGPLVEEWDVMLAALAAISIIVGNVGALWQNSLKRMLAYSGIAQAGYMVAGIVVATQAGVDAMVFYLAAYVLMNLAAFSVVVIHERQTGFSDDIDSLRGLGRSKPLLAWPLTIAMLALAGLPPTAGFIGKLYLIEALVDADWTWLGVMIAIGTMISLAYYLRVVATVWMSPAAEESAESKIDTAAVPDYLAGAPAEDEFLDPDADRRGYLVLPAIAGAALSVFFGVIPQPLVEFAQHAGNDLVDLLAQPEHGVPVLLSQVTKLELDDPTEFVVLRVPAREAADDGAQRGDPVVVLVPDLDLLRDDRVVLGLRLVGVGDRRGQSDGRPRGLAIGDRGVSDAGGRRVDRACHGKDMNARSSRAAGATILRIAGLDEVLDGRRDHRGAGDHEHPRAVGVEQPSHRRSENAHRDAARHQQ